MALGQASKLAFNTKLNKFGVRLKAFFSSDIGH
jgi:hypothetical protein